MEVTSGLSDSGCPITVIVEPIFAEPLFTEIPYGSPASEDYYDDSLYLQAFPCRTALVQKTEKYACLTKAQKNFIDFVINVIRGNY